MSTEQQNNPLTVRILGREYTVACPPEEREALLASAEHVAKRMSAIQNKGKTVGTERVAVMAALNISRDLLAMQQQDSTADEDLHERLQQLQLRMESTLDDTR